MKSHKLTFENKRTCTIECEETGKPLQDKINEAENRFGSPVVKINDKEVKEHSLGGFLLGAVIGGALGNSVAKSGVKKTASKIGLKTKKAVGNVKKDISEFKKASTKKFSVGGGIEETDIQKLGGHYSSYYKGISAGTKSEGYVKLLNEEDVKNWITDKLGKVVKSVKLLELGKTYPYNRDNPYRHDFYLVTLKNGIEFTLVRAYGRPAWSGNVDWIENISVKDIKNQKKMATGGGVGIKKDWEVIGITMQGKKFKKIITLGRMSDQTDVKNALRRMDLQIREVTSIKELKKYSDGGQIEFKDGFTFKEVSKEYAEKNFQNESIFGINVSQETESLIESKEDLDDFEVFGIEIGFQDKFAEGGLVGKHAIFDRFGEQKMGIITEDLGDGRLIVISGMGQYAVTPDNLISITEPVEKKGFFSFGKGGGVYNRSWHQDHNRHNKAESYEKPMSERSKKFAKGGMSEHGLRIGDEIIRDYSEFGFNEVQIKDGYGKNHVVSLESGKRSEPFAKGGSTEYNRSWHQDHNRHNKAESYEKPMSERSKKFSGGGGVKILYSGSELNRRFELSKQEILADVKSGKVPKSVNSFSELQNYVDANCYGGLCDNDYKISSDYSFENKLQLILNHWIEQGGIKGSSKYANGGKITKQPDGTYTHPSGYVIEPAYDKGRYILLDPDGMDAVGESMTLKEAKETLLDNVENYEFGNGGYLVQYGPGNKQTIISTKSEADDFVKTLKEKGHTNIKVRSKSEYKKQYESTSKDIKMDLQKRFNINPNSYALILSEKGKWKISPVNIKDWMNNYGSIQTVEQEINKQYKKFSGGGGVERERYNLSFNYNPGNLSNEYAEKIVEEFTNDWKHDNDWDNVSFYVFNLTKQKADELKATLQMEDVFNVEIEKSIFDNGGGVPSVKKYRLLSPDGFDIEMDKVYTEEELMPAFEQFKKRFEKQGYYSTGNRERINLSDLGDSMTVIETKEFED